jgi:hypothetical protein
MKAKKANPARMVADVKTSVFSKNAPWPGVTVAAGCAGCAGGASWLATFFASAGL